MKPSATKFDRTEEDFFLSVPIVATSGDNDCHSTALDFIQLLVGEVRAREGVTDGRQITGVVKQLGFGASDCRGPQELCNIVALAQQLPKLFCLRPGWFLVMSECFVRCMRWEILQSLDLASDWICDFKVSIRLWTSGENGCPMKGKRPRHHMIRAFLQFE